MKNKQSISSNSVGDSALSERDLFTLEIAPNDGNTPKSVVRTLRSIADSIESGKIAAFKDYRVDTDGHYWFQWWTA